MPGFEDLANTWLSESQWQKVFKHTLDVLQDYVSYILVTVGALALSVRLLTTLGSGDLACIIIGAQYGNATNASRHLNDEEPGGLGLAPYATGGTMGMISYAQTEESCIRNVFTYFMEYLPYIMLLETIILVIVDKFTFRIPRIAQKVERFYKNIVEESLFGKDPDVAEDLTDPKTSTESISRMRQRNEICVSLKRSSIIHHVYIAKNITEFLIVCGYLPLDIFYALRETDSSTRCEIPILNFPGLVPQEGNVFFQCKGKKEAFFMLALWIQIVLLGCYTVLSVGRLIWCFRFRSVSLLLETIESVRKKWEPSAEKHANGSDFLFLFDLLAHSCGLESTLRVLTHSDENFYEICKPNLKQDTCLTLEEDKVKISWQPADIERWLHAGQDKSRYRSITIESYEVTIFPAESVKRTKTVAVNQQCNKDLVTTNENGEKTYSTWFYDLSGGKTEYVITIACMIGKSRMKGEKVVCNLVPYGPEKPRTGMLKTAGTNQVEIFWDPPKGDFTRYILTVEKIVDKQQQQQPAAPALSSSSSGEPNFLRMMSNSKTQTAREEVLDDEIVDQTAIRQFENISSKLTTYTILGLDPGEKYRIQLGTKTGNVHTRQTVTDVVMTKPLPVAGFMCTDVDISSCVLHWLIPEGHPCLKGFLVKVINHDGKPFRDFAVTKAINSFTVLNLVSGYDYEIRIQTLCVFETQRTESEPVVANITTLPDCVKNLRQETANGNAHSLLLRWDLNPPAGSHIVKQKLGIDGVDVKFSTSLDLPGDKSIYNFSKLPDPEGAGRQYRVTIVHTLNTIKDNVVQSAATSEVFATPPHRPSNLTPGRKLLQLLWTKSPTSSVSGYRIRWKVAEGEGVETMEDYVSQADQEEWQSFSFPTLLKEVVYKVAVTAVVNLPEGKTVESRELTEKIVWKSDTRGLDIVPQSQ